MQVKDIREILKNRGRSQDTIDALIAFIQYCPKGNRMYESLWTIASDSILDTRVKLSEKQLGKIKGWYQMDQLRAGKPNETNATDNKRIVALEETVLTLAEQVAKLTEDLHLVKRIILKQLGK